jgi:hypothetical protein
LPPPGVASVRRLRVAHAESLGSAGASLCVQRCVVGVSPPSCSRQSLASFSSDGRGGKVSFDEAKRLNGRLVASASVRELLSVVHASHQDFDAVNVSTSWNKLAKLAGGGERRGLMRRGDREDVANAVQLLSKETPRVVNALKPREVSSTLWAFGKLAERGVDVDVAVVRAVSDSAVRVASKMEPQHVSNSMHAFANLAENGVEVDAAAVRAVSAAAVGVAGGMEPQHVSNTLWGFAKLSEKGVDVDAAAVRAVSDEAPRVAGEMVPQAVSNTLWAVAKMSEKGVDVDAAAVRAVSAEARRVAGEMDAQAVSNTLWAFAKLSEKGVDVDAAAVRAVSAAAVGVAGGMDPQGISNTLYAFVELSENGVAVDAAAVQAVSAAAPRVAGEMIPQHISNTLYAFAKLSEKGVDVDAAAVRAVSNEAPRVAGGMNAQDVATTMWSWGTLVANGFQFTSVFGESSWVAVVTRAQEVHLHMNAQDKQMTQRGLDIITRADEEAKTKNVANETNPHPTSERTSSSFWAAGERWLSKLPDGKRAKLESALSAAQTDPAKLGLLVASAEADTTKVRAAERAILLEAAAAAALLACSQEATRGFLAQRRR